MRFSMLGHQPAALGNQADLDRLVADGIGLVDDLAVVGRVRDLGFQADQGVALVQRLTHEVIGQLDLELDVAVRRRSCLARSGTP